jgi:FkbM family methyltransferase
MTVGELIAQLPLSLRRHSVIQALLKVAPKSNLALLTYNNDARAWVDLNDANARQNLITGSFEPEFFAIAAPFLQNGGLFFDVGANYGLCTFGLIALLKETPVKYHLFEANDQICSLLERSAAAHSGSSIMINFGCVTNAAGTSNLAIVPGHTGQSYICTEGALSVPNLTLDDYLESNQIAQVELLKMDIEGHEPLALQGAAKSLDRGAFDVIYLEISTVNLARNNHCPDHCLDFLRQSGYRLFYCKPIDLKRYAKHATPIKLSVNGRYLELLPLQEYEDHYQTDILAIHHKSKYSMETESIRNPSQ